ncbi:hypothetical protein AWB75_06700 [Caballeronia catudaia]|uniref:ACT domain-containing protein n=1 Tax=Caballeronia catudaia TaxID=1777136 RepID=A0A158DIL3_9BURK|nr:hypothetical protein [Caballeronia catudaia]SAK93647.1 hypothetical protein AWB75_06700 [Caballeronia catudaia]
MYRTTGLPVIPHAFNGGSPRRRESRHCLAFDLTVPGLNSAPARELLAHAFGADARAHVVATNRRHDCTTLYVETDDVDANAVIGKIIAWFPNATLGRVIRITRR